MADKRIIAGARRTPEGASFLGRVTEGLDFGMSSRWVRLVAWVALVAYIAGNGTAIAHHSLPLSGCRCGDVSCGSSEGGSPGDTPTSPCKHCRAAQKPSAPAVDFQGADKRQDDLPNPSCPCENQNSPKPSCPCPGGCMFCSLAKVPCHFPPMSFLVSPTFAARALVEAPVFHAFSVCCGLFRPPRA